jgi:endonuclease YncB( thermonuclease family)
MWSKFRSWPLWAQIVAWVFAWPIVWTIWVVQKGLWPRWVRAGLVGAAWGFILFVALSPTGENGPAVADAEPAAAQAAPAPTTTSVVETTTAGTDTEAEPPPPPPPPRVARVIDGDTIELDNGDRIRLVQIDAPERHGECYGANSSRVLHQLLPVGSKVRLATDPRLDKIDRYGRLLRYVYKGKRNVNLVLVERGAANAYFFQGDRGRFAGRLRASASDARQAGNGAWGACDASTDVERSWTVRNQPKEKPRTAVPTNCHPSYKGACLDPNSPDYDCEGGSGNGPDYTGLVQVVGYDEYELDADGDGYGCE